MKFTTLSLPLTFLLTTTLANPLLLPRVTCTILSGPARCYSGPGSGSIVRTIPSGTSVSFSCYRRGSCISGGW